MVATVLTIFLRINYFGLHIFQYWTPHFGWTPHLKQTLITSVFGWVRQNLAPGGEVCYLQFLVCPYNLIYRLL